MNKISGYLFSSMIPFFLYGIISEGAYWHIGSLIIVTIISLWFLSHSKHENKTKRHE